MKVALGVIVLVLLTLSLGYFGLPILIEKETSGLRTEVQALKQKLEKMEEESRVAPLQPGADTQKIIEVVNSLVPEVKALEDSLKKGTSETDDTLRKQKATIQESLKKQSEAVDKIARYTETNIHKSMFYALMATARGNFLKVKVDLAARNIGTARSEMELTLGTLEKAKAQATAENRKVIEELQGILNKARADLDTDLPSAITRIDLLWAEMSKLLQKA